MLLSVHVGSPGRTQSNYKSSEEIKRHCGNWPAEKDSRLQQKIWHKKKGRRFLVLHDIWVSWQRGNYNLNQNSKKTCARWDKNKQTKNNGLALWDQSVKNLNKRFNRTWARKFKFMTCYCLQVFIPTCACVFRTPI